MQLVVELLGKSLLIGTAIVVIMLAMGFRLGEIYLVGTTAACAAMLMAITEYDAIAAERNSRDR